MATASDGTEGTQRRVMPYVAYGVVLALLGLAAVGVWAYGGSGLRGLAGAPAPSPAGSRAASAAVPFDPSTAPGLKLPPRPAPAEAPASAPAPMAAREAAPPAASPAKPEPAQAEPATRTEPPPAEPPKTEPLKTVCKADLGRWPAGKLDQGQILQMMLRDLGFYRGTTNGTVGPQTQAAIREFQLAVGEADTGEPSEALFEALKKKCAATPP